MAEEGYSAEAVKRRKGGHVNQAGNNELAAMTEALESAFANVSRTSVTDLGLRQLSELANEVGVSSFIGRVALAGQNSDGTFRVQFNVDGDGGFVSLWPQWAFELAKAALLSDKRIWVISKGDPMGDNLLQVSLVGF
jgi:hypothetical protein